MRNCIGRLALLLVVCGLAAGPAQAREIETLRDLFVTLRSCWRPPPANRAFADMKVTVRFSLKSNGELIGEPRITFVTPSAPPATADAYREAAISSVYRCLPLPLSTKRGGAVAGRPLALQFTDRRQRMRQADDGRNRSRHTILLRLSGRHQLHHTAASRAFERSQVEAIDDRCNLNGMSFNLASETSGLRTHDQPPFFKQRPEVLLR